MSLTTKYAKALFSAKNPSMAHVREALKRRGHERLLSRVIAECQKLQLRADRLETFKKVTPERRQTKVLLELYRKLVATN